MTHPADWDRCRGARRRHRGRRAPVHAPVAPAPRPTRSSSAKSSRAATCFARRPASRRNSSPTRFGHWDARVRDAVRAAGYRGALTLDFGLNGEARDRWALRRDQRACRDSLMPRSKCPGVRLSRSEHSLMIMQSVLSPRPCLTAGCSVRGAIGSARSRFVRAAPVPTPMSSCAKGSRTTDVRSGGTSAAIRASGPCLNSRSAPTTGLASTIAAPPGATGWSSIRNGAFTATTRGGRFRRSPSSTSAGTQYISNPHRPGHRSRTSPFLLHDQENTITAYVGTNRNHLPVVRDSGPGMPHIANYQDVDTPETGGRTRWSTGFRISRETSRCSQAARGISFEWYVRLNSPGLSNGVTRLWIDDATDPDHRPDAAHGVRRHAVAE